MRGVSVSSLLLGGGFCMFQEQIYFTGQICYNIVDI